MLGAPLGQVSGVLLKSKHALSRLIRCGHEGNFRGPPRNMVFSSSIERSVRAFQLYCAPISLQKKELKLPNFATRACGTCLGKHHHDAAVTRPEDNNDDIEDHSDCYCYYTRATTTTELLLLQHLLQRFATPPPPHTAAAARTATTTRGG